jgi:hypothetical protein
MVGLIFIKDVLRLLEKRQPVVLRKIRHPVHLVPETKKVGELLKDLQKRRDHMALVIDEHGSLTGLVTLEDLLEEIVGEIHDEYDWEERPVERLRDGSLVVDGTVPARTCATASRCRSRSPTVRDGRGLHAGRARLGPARRGGGGARRAPADGRRRREEPHQQGQDRPAGGGRRGPARLTRQGRAGSVSLCRCSTRAASFAAAALSALERREERVLGDRRARPGPDGRHDGVFERGGARAPRGQLLVHLEGRRHRQDRDRPGQPEAPRAAGRRTAASVATPSGRRRVRQQASRTRACREAPRT